MIRYLLNLTLALGLLTCSLPGQAAISDAEAVNRAGMQRMLSQRVAKSYLMLGTETRVEVAVVQLDQSIADLETNSQLLQEYAPTAPIRAALNEANETWQRYREVVLTNPNKERALQVLQLSDQALEQNEKLVKLIEQHTGNQAAQLVNRSGRQRMLSQRIAKLYLAMSWHLPAEQLRTEFDTAVQEFDQGIKDLRRAPQNTTEINQRLDQIATQWRFAQAGFSLASDSRYVPTVIVTTTETLLRKVNELTGRYEELANAR
ncbi:MAG: type IV pili methyl-accepting chemotaxis transducer N-terminal domain-containing protein [Pseudomonas sp.]